MTVCVLASSGATSRHEMWVCGAPCSSSSGGPVPACTTLISAPEVFTRAAVNPGKNSSPPAAGWAVAAGGRGANAESPAMAIDCFRTSRREEVPVARISEARARIHVSDRAQLLELRRRSRPWASPAPSAPAAGRAATSRCADAPSAPRGRCVSASAGRPASSSAAPSQWRAAKGSGSGSSYSSSSSSATARSNAAMRAGQIAGGAQDLAFEDAAEHAEQPLGRVAAELRFEVSAVFCTRAR